MLVLSRKKDQKIVIEVLRPDDTTELIEVTIVDIRGDSVRVGIDADKEHKIFCKEDLVEGALPKTGSCPSRAVQNSRSATGPNPPNLKGRTMRFGR